MPCSTQHATHHEQPQSVTIKHSYMLLLLLLLLLVVV
jgi:hypothetical protein